MLALQYSLLCLIIFLFLAQNTVIYNFQISMYYGYCRLGSRWPGWDTTKKQTLWCSTHLPHNFDGHPTSQCLDLVLKVRPSIGFFPVHSPICKLLLSCVCNTIKTLKLTAHIQWETKQHQAFSIHCRYNDEP